MSEAGRNRLIGGVVLLSLGVIFLPMLFDGAGIERRTVPVIPAGDPGLDDDADAIDPASADWSFVEEVDRRRADPERVDGRPRSVPTPAEDPVRALAVEDLAAGDDEDDGATRAPGTRSPSLDARGAPVAYSVQLASFEDAENAERLRATLIGDGYEAYVDTRAQDAAPGTPLYRVAVGPRVDAASVRRLQAELSERYELDGLIVRFTVGRGD